MLEVLTPLISNGTTALRMGYEPWLPFYNFVPITVFSSVVIAVLTRRAFWGINFTVSSFMALIPTYGLWRALELEPNAVFIVWVINTAFLIWTQHFMILQRKRWLKNLKAGQDHTHRASDFEEYEDYLQHIKIAHPDIWKEFHEEKEK